MRHPDIVKRVALPIVLAVLPLVAGSAHRADASTTSTTIMSQNFDSQSPGNLAVGGGANDFNSVVTSANVQVISTTFNTPPNSLDTLTSSMVSTARVTKSYEIDGNSYAAHTLTFRVKEDDGYRYAAGGYVSLACVRTNSETSAGQVVLVDRGPTFGDNSFYIQWTDPNFGQHYLYGEDSPMLQGTGWHTVSLAQDVSTGSITLTIDGTTVISATGLDLGLSQINWFTIGQYAHDATGRISYDDVTTTTP